MSIIAAFRLSRLQSFYEQKQEQEDHLRNEEKINILAPHSARNLVEATSV